MKRSSQQYAWGACSCANAFAKFWDENVRVRANSTDAAKVKRGALVYTKLVQRMRKKKPGWAGAGLLPARAIVTGQGAGEGERTGERQTREGIPSFKTTGIQRY